jgi:NDP-sugar pyrophosphorylase family protein
MYPLTERIPKALIPVLGVPFVDHQLRWLAAHGVSEVVLSLGHLGEQIEAHVGDGTRAGVPVRYVHEGSALRGTAGALRLAHDQGLLAEAFLVTYGDSYLPIDFGAVAQAFLAGARPALMTVFRNDGRWDKSNVVFEASAGLITLYDKLQKQRPVSEFRYIDYGVSALLRETVPREVPADVKCDLAEVFQRLSLRGELAGFEVSQRFYEIGSPAGLADLESHLRATAPAARSVE